MNEREKLIQDVAKAISEEAYDGGHGTMGRDQFDGMCRLMAERALSVFEKKPEPASDNPELTKILESLGIDRSTVIDALLEVTARYMWRTEAAWPAGGTYEADVPRNSGDKMVAQRLTTKATIDIIGRHPAGRELPPSSSDYTRSRIETTDDGDWVTVE